MRTSLARLFGYPKYMTRAPRSAQLPGTLLGPPGPTREETLKAIEEHTKKHKGLRQGWQVKAATWVKRVHVNRGHVEVGVLTKDGQFKIHAAAKPRYIVPAGLATTKLRPYVAPYDEAKVLAELQKKQVLAAQPAAVAAAAAAT